MLVLQILFALSEIIFLAFFTIYVFLHKFFRWIWPLPLKSLNGEVILITGTGNGIGKQLVLQLANIAPCATLICWDIDAVSNEATVAQVKALGAKNVHGFQIDITNRKVISQTALKIKTEIGDVTMIFNIAGISQPITSFLNQDPDLLAKTFHVNVFAQTWILQEFLPGMIAQKNGHIVQMGSILALRPLRDLSGYIGSKFAINGVIECLKIELHAQRSPVQFTTVYPFQVDTGLFGPAKVQPKYKFPFFFPSVLMPECVASKTINGVRRREEFVYVPWYAQVPAMISQILPNEIHRRMEDVLLSYELVKHE